MPVHQEDDTVKPRALNLIFVLSLALLAVAGCSNHDGNEWERVVCEVESINLGQPLVSAYLNVGSDQESGTDDDTFPIDIVPVLFRARPYNGTMIIPEDAAQSWFHVTNYDLIWHGGPGAPAELSQHNITNGMCEAIVPLHEEGVTSVLIADRVLKDAPWFVNAVVTNGGTFTAACELHFKGHESGNSRVVTVEAGFMVTFIGAVADD